MSFQRKSRFGPAGSRAGQRTASQGVWLNMEASGYGDTYRNQTIHVNSPPPQNNPYLLLVCQKVLLGFSIRYHEKIACGKNLNGLFGQPNTVAQTKYLITLFIIWEQVLLNEKVDKIRKQLGGETKSLGYSMAPPNHTLHSPLPGAGHGVPLSHTAQMCTLDSDVNSSPTSHFFFFPIALSWKKKFSFKKWIWFLVKNTQFRYQKLAWVQLFPVCTRNRLDE